MGVKYFHVSTGFHSSSLVSIEIDAGRMIDVEVATRTNDIARRVIFVVYGQTSMARVEALLSRDNSTTFASHVHLSRRYE